MSSLVRKTFWPAAIVVGFLVFLGAIGQGISFRQAEAGVTEAICGPEVIQVDETVWYIAVFSDIGEEDEATWDLDDVSGDSDITSYISEDVGHVDGIQTDFISNIDMFEVGPGDDLGDLEDFLDLLDDEGADFDFEDLLECAEFDADDFADDIDDDLKDKINAGESVLGCVSVNYGNPHIDPATCPYDVAEDPFFGGTPDIDCPDATPTDPPFCAISGDIIQAVIDALVAEIMDANFDCEDLSEEAKKAALNAGATTAIAEQFMDAIWAQCEAGDLFDLGFEGVSAVDVTCEEPGEFNLSAVGEQDDPEPDQIHVVCVGEVDDMRLTATPNIVETVPTLGQVEFSLIVAELLDEDDDPIVAGVTVDFSTNRCEFYDEDGITDEATLRMALDVFGDYDPNDPATATAVNNFIDSLPDPDRDDVSNDVASFNLTDDAGDFDEGDAIAAIILDCSSNTIAPGTATVTAQIDQEGEDITKTVTVTVVGPPASVSASASAANVTCGDTAQIVVQVRDAAGQNVSPHTRVEAVTNFGGVLGGTGAVAGQQGLVTPVSSTVAETFNGVATFTLITSDTHVGAYNVVIATGGGGAVTGFNPSALGGAFSTPVVTTQVTVTCAMPTTAAPVAPTVTAPRTGTGITPPNTGDAGLVSTSSGASLSLFVIAGVAAFALAGVATLKFARR